ncbi:hypothetical protein, conserved in T. vivax [Trypanosoma vivax Y486]|uniref:Uncharacterized protein n=1 Tax=Trypanosoma vivax (strain Y486) TaxID=1055687 RepID=F9WVX2_TRYVY|nr:hypothetical protein, conserved in T. vivax [Trypanosoma vivax Y486]|eukprot:CCD21736.1 hypothetical protein, conserved in T. vivax [Trypanosoma vivax Y486]
MAHAHRSAAAEHGERCSHHFFAAAAPHPGKQQHATKWKVKFHSRHRTHSRVTAHTTQLSAQAHLAHARVSLPRKRAHAVAAAAPQATQQASNSAATSAAASTVASSAVALRSATARSAAARHAAQQPDQPCGKRSSFSAATRRSTFESVPHWQCYNTRATAPTTQASSAACAASVICASSHRPRPRRWTGSVMATAGRGPSATASSARVPAGASRVRAARPPNANRHATASGSGAAKHSPQLCRSSKPRVRRSNGKPAHSSRRAAQHPRSKNFSQRRAALSGILWRCCCIRFTSWRQRFLRALLTEWCK